MAYKKRIKLVIVTDDSISTSEIKAPHVTETMIQAAYDLVYAMCTGKLRKRAKKKPKKTITRK